MVWGTCFEGRTDEFFRRLTVGVFALLFPVIAIVPRAMPVWAILTAVIAAVRLFRAGGTRGLLPARTVDTAPVSALLLLTVVSLTWTPSPRAVPTVLEIGYVSLGALLIGRLVGRASAAELSEIRRAVLVGAAFASVVWVFDVVLDHPVHRWMYHLPDDLTINMENIAKRTADVAALVVWPLAALVPRRFRASALLSPALFAGVVWLGGSRSAAVGATIGAVVLLAAFIRPTITRRATAAVLVLAFVLAVPAAIGATRNQGVSESEWLFPSARHRVEIWGHAARRVVETPFLGLGIDASRAITPRPNETSRFGEITDSLLPLHPHNAPLQIWLELGGVGAALALLIALRLLSAVGRLPAAIVPPALALFASGMLMANTAYGVWQAWWMSAYLAAGLLTFLAARIEDGRGP